MLDFWRDTRKEDDDKIPQYIKYRATSPIYAGETYRAMMQESGHLGKTKIELWGCDGKLAMHGEILKF